MRRDRSGAFAAKKDYPHHHTDYHDHDKYANASPDRDGRASLPAFFACGTFFLVILVVLVDVDADCGGGVLCFARFSGPSVRTGALEISHKFFAKPLIFARVARTLNVLSALFSVAFVTIVTRTGV